MIDFINKLIASNDEYIYLIGVNAEIINDNFNGLLVLIVPVVSMDL